MMIVIISFAKHKCQPSSLMLLVSLAILPITVRSPVFTTIPVHVPVTCHNINASY